MSLRATLILGITLVLLVSLTCGSVLVYWHAVSRVDTEMHAALAVGEHTILSAVDDMKQDVVAPLQLISLVRSLDGDRHLRATLIAKDGAILARSAPLTSAEPAPLWFQGLLVRPPYTARIAVPSGSKTFGIIALETDSHNEIGEIWSDAIVTVAILVLFCCLSALLVYWATGRALRPLNAIITAFQRIGDGNYAPEVPERGPHELVQLARGFNRMVRRLVDMAGRKDRLEEQLVEVQEEERAELARDLHDEIGPLLFAVSVDLMALEQYEAIRTEAELRSRLHATGEAVSRMQQHVKDILGRLRPPTIADLGLLHSTERLVAFWRTRYPAVSFYIDISEESLSANLGARIYRIVQESVSNALRHGRPARIDIEVARESCESLLVEVRDDGIGLQPDGPHAGLGLMGMRERVAALAGNLEVTVGLGGRGVRVRARLPVAAADAAPPPAATQERPA
jgi:two-component system, NarL family, sensor histidine kinase UhpB